ncbi:hypothetical protein ACI796_17410 [Geodermatophilus sp. SYSU D00525]
MSAPTLPAPRRTSSSPVPPGDGLGIADLLDLLGLGSDAGLPADAPHASALDAPALDAPAPDAPALDAPALDARADRVPVDPVAVVRGWVRRAAAWGAGPQRSWCAW